jgi:tetratricopeptide (TPR) repeat protein
VSGDRVKIENNNSIGQAIFLVLILFFSLSSQAANRVLDHIEVKPSSLENLITIHFDIPVRYVSHVVNNVGNQANIQLQLIQTPDSDLRDRIDTDQEVQPLDLESKDLVDTDQLTWQPTAEIPLDKIEFQRQFLGTSSLLISFSAPVRDFQIRQGRDFYVLELALKKHKKVEDLTIPAVPAPKIEDRKLQPPRIFRDLPLVIFVINLSSQREEIDFNQMAPIPVADDQILYITQAEVDGRVWNRMRLGFFRTMKEANKELKQIVNYFPNAWVDRADVEEQRKALAMLDQDPEQLITGKKEKSVEIRQPKKEIVKPADDRLAKMMELTRRTMTAGEYTKAVRMLTAILEEPDNPYAKEAKELLGLARERNGQIAHAKAEYRAYLELYPEGKDAKRVKQRLLGLVTATQQPREPLRQEAEQEEDQVEWETYGSLSQNYRRDEIDSPFVEDDERVSRSEIATFLDINTRRRSSSTDMRLKVTTSRIYDLLDEGDNNDTTLSDAYIDVEHIESLSSMRLGRQRLRSSGVHSRFDGLVLGYGITPDTTIRLAGGLPVERSTDVHLHEHKQFLALSGEFSNIFDNWDFSLFVTQQQVDDLIDRRAVGGEVRYFDPRRSLFGMVDYDIHYSSLNILLLQGNWTFEDETRVYMNLDYRNSPLLTTSNVIGHQIETEPDLFLTIEEVEQLEPFLSEDEVYELAEERTAETKTVSLGVSRPLFPTLQLSGDVTVVNTGDTIVSEGTGNEYFYTFQMVKNNLLKEGDIGIFSARYSDTSSSNTIQLSLSSRYPITNFWRINPRITVARRENDNNDGSRLQASPFLKLDYRIRKSVTLETELGMNWYKEDDGTETIIYKDYFIFGGYRWDF